MDLISEFYHHHIFVWQKLRMRRFVVRSPTQVKVPSYKILTLGLPSIISSWSCHLSVFACLMLAKTHIWFIKKMYMWVSESSMCLKVVWKYRFKAAPHTFDYVEWFFTLIFSLFHFSLKLGRFSSCQHLCLDSFNWKPKHNNAHQFTLVTRLARQKESSCWPFL